jgi:predicted permease
MAEHTRIFVSIVALVGLILLAMGLRRLGVVKEEHGAIFAKLVTQVTLPALIFVSLVKSPVQGEYVKLALAMLAAEVACLFLARLAGRWMRLNPPQLGAVVLTAGFGSSSLLGYALIGQVFPDDAKAVTEAVVISELGVGPALFVLGTLIAIYYGSAKTDPKQRWLASLRFFWSPIFVSVLVGLLWSRFGPPATAPAVQALLDGIAVLGSANTLLVTLTVGLLLHFQGLRSLFLVVALVVTIKLLIKPVLVWLPGTAMGLSGVEMQVLILEAAMPSALLTVVLAGHYGCDAQLASKLVLATTAGSLITVLTMFRILA